MVISISLVGNIEYNQYRNWAARVRYSFGFNVRYPLWHFFGDVY